MKFFSSEDKYFCDGCKGIFTEFDVKKVDVNWTVKDPYERRRWKYYICKKCWINKTEGGFGELGVSNPK